MDLPMDNHPYAEIIILPPPQMSSMLTPKGGIISHTKDHASTAASSPVLSSLVACIWCLLRRLFHPRLRRICRRSALSVRGPISTQGPLAALLLLVVMALWVEEAEKDESPVVVVVAAAAAVEEEIAAEGRAWARAADLVKGLGTLMILASCSLARTGTGAARISATPKSRTKVCRNQVRRRPRKVGPAPRAVCCNQTRSAHVRVKVDDLDIRVDEEKNNVPMNLVPNILKMVWAVRGWFLLEQM